MSLECVEYQIILISLYVEERREEREEWREGNDQELGNEEELMNTLHLVICDNH